MPRSPRSTRARTRSSGSSSREPCASTVALMLSQWPAGRRVLFTTVFCLAVALSIAALLQGLAPSGWLRMAELAGIILTATAVIGGGIGLAVAKLADYRDPESEEEFERLVLRS